MGRKIPGKKHKGVKDPEKQQEQRLNSLKDKINNPPKDPDDQPIPKSLQKIMNLKKRFNSGDEEVRVKRKSKSRSGLISTESKKIKRINMSNDKSSANFTQLPGESSKAFLNRVNQTVKQYLKEAEFENKYGVNIKRSTETGQIIGVEQKPVDEFEQLLKKPSKELKKGKGKIKQTEPKLTKSQKRLKKLADKKERKELDRIDEFAKFADQVPFGEVATAPPTLPTPKKVSKTNLAPRPGKKELLFKRALGTSPVSVQQMAVSKVTIANKLASQSVDEAVLDKKVKRKDMPPGMRRQIEKDQEEVIAAYRKLKLKKTRETLGSG